MMNATDITLLSALSNETHQLIQEVILSLLLLLIISHGTKSTQDKNSS